MRITGVVAGFLAGVAALGMARAFGALPEPVHHHANFAVLLQGTRFDFSPERYQEDVAACYGTGGISAPDRVHLHNGNPEVVHIHHDGVTWGHFFQNLGWALGRDFLITDAGARYFDGEGGNLVFVLNGFPVADVHERAVASADRLLVAFGSETAEEAAERLFPQVPADAHHFNELPDPATCSGGGHGPMGIRDRLRSGFWR